MKHVITSLFALFIMVPVIATAECSANLNQEYRQQILGNWEFDEQFDADGVTYVGRANYSGNGRFSARVVNLNNSYDVVATVYGTWSIDNCVLTQTITRSDFITPGQTTKDEIIQLDAQQLKLRDKQDGELETYHRI